MRLYYCLAILLISVSSAYKLVAQASNYPARSNIVDITKAPYSADPTGVADATAIINQAFIDHNDSHTIIYFPEGTYRITDRIQWGSPAGCESGSTYTCHRYTVMAGEGIEKTILKLDDNASGFNDPNNPKLMIWTQTSAAMSFENGVRNLTINSGSGNPGVSALGFEANNQGGIQNVKIISPDGQGVIGLHMGTGDQAGPCLIRDLEVEGYNWGVYTFANQNSIYFERLTLKNQNQYGFYNRQQSVAIKDLYSENQVPAIYNHSDGGSIITMINSELKGIGNASSEIAFLNNNRREIFLRNVNVSGYNLALQQLQNGFSLETIPPGFIIEYTTDEPSRICDNALTSLNLPIKDTPSIIYEDTSLWVSITDFGAEIDNGFSGKGSIQDDTEAIEDAFNSGAEIILVPGPIDPFPQRFIAYDTIDIPATVSHIIGAKGLISGNVTFNILPGTDTLIIEDFAQFQNIIHHSARPLILKNLGIKKYESNPAGGSGDVFIEDVVGGPYTFNFQSVWARQCNTERENVNIINNGGNLWILGMKTEKKGTAIRTINGGKTEVLGTLFYGTLPDENPVRPIFEVIESSFSVAGFKELGYINDAWDIKVRETRNGITNDFEIGNIPIRASLFVSYPSTGINQQPTIDAGPDQILMIDSDSTQFNPIANDDGLPSGGCYATTLWKQLSGPASLIIENNSELQSKFYFSESGVYTLQVSYNDGALMAMDTVLLSIYDHYSSTEDHNQDGTPSGNGADANLRGWSNFLKNYGGTDSFGPRHYNQFPAKSIFRIDVSAFQNTKNETSRLQLEIATTNTGLIEDWTYNVFGLNDGDSGENWKEGNLMGTESMAGEVNYDNAPGFSDPFGGTYDPTDLTSGGVDHTRARFLGTINTRKRIREKISFSSDELTEFINEDTTGAVTFLITRATFALNTIVFASKEHETFSSPTLYYDKCNKQQTIYIDPASSGRKSGDSWEHAYTSWEDISTNPCYTETDTIKMAEGTFSLASVNRNNSFWINHDLVIMGGYKAGGTERNPETYKTTISGNINDPNQASDNLKEVISIGAEGNVVLDGIVIEDGNPDSTQQGAAIRCHGTLICKNIKSRNHVIGNNASDIYILSGGNITFTNSNTIED